MLHALVGFTFFGLQFSSMSVDRVPRGAFVNDHVLSTIDRRDYLSVSLSLLPVS